MESLPQTSPQFNLPIGLEVNEPIERSILPALGAILTDPIPVSCKDEGFVLLPATGNHAEGERMDAATRIRGAIVRMEKGTGRRFGDAQAPLLLTLLRHWNADGVGQTIRVDHVGLGDQTMPAFLDSSDDPKMVYAAYTHLILQFARILPDRRERSRRRAEGSLWTMLHRRLDEFLVGRGYRHAGECTAQDWAYLSGTFKAILRFAAGIPFPDDPWSQLWTLLSYWTTEDRYADVGLQSGTRCIRVASI